jgi:hypothetical protein
VTQSGQRLTTPRIFSLSCQCIIAGSHTPLLIDNLLGLPHLTHILPSTRLQVLQTIARTMTSNVSCATTTINHRGLPYLDIFTGSHSLGTQCFSNNSRIFQTPCIFRAPFIPPTHSFLSMTILVVLRAEEGITQTTDRTARERHSSSPYSCNICSFFVLRGTIEQQFLYLHSSTPSSIIHISTHIHNLLCPHPSSCISPP